MHKLYIISILFSLAFLQHFNLNIGETGESTLFIFQDSITGLGILDQIGLFDVNGIIDSEGNLGEVLVGTGYWTGSQMEIVAIHGIDLSQFVNLHFKLHFQSFF